MNKGSHKLLKKLVFEKWTEIMKSGLVFINSRYANPSSKNNPPKTCYRIWRFTNELINLLTILIFLLRLLFLLVENLTLNSFQFENPSLLFNVT